MLLSLSRFLVGLVLMSFAGAAYAQQPTLRGGAQRAALVIGNRAYAQAPIDTALDGARSVADALLQGGFKVVFLQNAWKDDIKQGLATFAQTLGPGGKGIIFYSGHAVQYQGRNYLVALDTQISSAEDVPREAIDVNLLLAPLIAARTTGSVVILDAARSNPWQSLLPGGFVGLAIPESVKSISFVFPTAPGNVVSDVPQAGGAFAAQLAQEMRTPDLGFNDVLSRTRAAVARINGYDQSLWQSGPAPSDLIVTPVAKAAGAKPVQTSEQALWDSIKNSASAADYQAYLNAYPNGQFAAAARSKLAQLQRKAPERAAAPGADARQSAAAKPDQPPPQPPAPATSSTSTPAAQTNPQVIRDCPTCPELVLIPAGTMMMGSTEGNAFEIPVHAVTISKPFYMGRREVTFDEWDACLGEGGCHYRPGDRGQGRGQRPASDLDWNDAKAYVAWLSHKTGKTYRLPSEAEWEYAARAGTKTTYYWGNTFEKDRANCSGCNALPLNQTMTTGSFPPNAFGLLDMAGNAAEWVEDCWSDNYKGAPNDGSAFTKPGCGERVLRGGSFNNDQRYIRTAARFKYDYDVRFYTNGFRVVREQ